MIKKVKIGLLPRIIIAMALGIVCGLFLPLWATRLFVTFNSLFSAFLGFIIPLLIVGYVSPAIADIGRRAGRMLVFTVALAYAATFLSGTFSYFVGQAVFPSLIEPVTYVRDVTASESLQPFFTIDIQPLMGVTTALVLAFTLGLTTAHLDPRSVMRGFLDNFRSIIDMVIRTVIIPLLPLYIFGIFLNMTVSGQAGFVLKTFLSIIAVIFVMHVVLLIVQYCIAAPFARRNPFKSLWTMLPAYFTALGTSSSAATIPVTLRQTIKNGVDPDVAGMTVPLCATIHMSGSTLKIVACALALMMMMGHHYDNGQFAQLIAMMGIAIVAAPGVPGGAIMASLGLLSGILGFTDADNALMIALYIAMDSFGTACNVTGDGALSQIVNRVFAGKGKQTDTGAES